MLVSVVDEDTMGCLEDAKVTLEDYEKVVEWIRAREVRLTSRSTCGSSGKDPNAMVYAMGEGPVQHEIHTPEASQDAGSSQRSASPWTPTAAGQDPWQGAPDPWESPPGLSDPYAQDLDAFGKGKGKQKGPLECYNCLGKGHPSRVCTSPQGAGKGNGAKCGNCGGKDHTQQPCARAIDCSFASASLF